MDICISIKNIEDARNFKATLLIHIQISLAEQIWINQSEYSTFSRLNFAKKFNSILSINL